MGPLRPHVTVNTLLIAMMALLVGPLLVACGERGTDAAVADEVVSDTPDIELDVPFVPTPHEIVAQMLNMAAVGADDHVIDLGSGDGRIVIAAVRDFGARSAEGIDLDPQRVTEAWDNARAAGVVERVHFEEGDLFDKDFSAATVLTLYLTQDINLRLRPRILDTLAPGSRVVSHVFHMGDWLPDDVAVMGYVSAFRWTVPAAVAGHWQSADADNAGDLALHLEQHFQVLSGTLRIDEQTLTVDDGRLAGHDITLRAGDRLLTGRVDGERMTLRGDDNRQWSITRQSPATTPFTD